MTPPVDPNGNGNGTGSDGAPAAGSGDRNLADYGLGPADLAAAADRIGDGDAVVYPTETVYGLGADALDPAAVERVYELKRRPRSNPVSLAVPSVEAALEHVAPTDRERAFMDAFLPGPVTVVVERRPSVPDRLTAGRERVGVRIPDHPVALALLDRVAPVPLTATSANRSGEGSARRVADVDADLLAACATLDAGTTPGGESTVVDPSSGIIRRGRQADAVEQWLDGYEHEDERERE